MLGRGRGTRAMWRCSQEVLDDTTHFRSPSFCPVNFKRAVVSFLGLPIACASRARLCTEKGVLS